MPCTSLLRLSSPAPQDCQTGSSAERAITLFLSTMPPIPDAAQNAVFVQSEDIDAQATKVKGPDFNFPIELQELLQSYGTTGFQASALSRAIEIVNKMVRLFRLGAPFSSRLRS